MRPRTKTLVLVVALLMVWQVGGGSILFPPPTKVFQALFNKSDLWMHVGATIARVGIALSIGLSLGVLSGILMGVSSMANKWIGAPMAILMPIPGIALAPLAIMIFGFGDIAIISIGILAATFPIAYNTAAGIKMVPRQIVEAARLDGANAVVTMLKVRIPLSLQCIYTGVKLSLSRCWRTIIAVEFVAAASRGIGYMIWDATEYLRMDVVLAGVAVLVLVYIVAISVPQAGKRVIHDIAFWKQYSKIGNRI